MTQLFLVGAKGITIEFSKLLEPQKPIIAFGPKDPPLRYLLNLKDIVQDSSCESIRDILDYTSTNESIWHPQKIKANEDLNKLILKSFESNDTVAIQGPDFVNASPLSFFVIIHVE